MNYCDDGIHCGCSDEVDRLLKLIEKREWVGLTKEEVDSWELPENPTVFEFAKFIETKLKEKNT